jgi:HAD superfamily, subfamily IIIB (Acid phosphatase)
MAAGTKGALAVFDLDGTLADVRHRLHHVAGSPRDWDAFFAAAGDDPPLAEGVALAHASVAEHGYEIAYLTGRPERCRKDTLAWLSRHGLPAGRLLMRPPGDRRPGSTTKPELLRRLARDRDIALVVDDDRLVCVAYERAGFHVVRADWATREAVLERAQEGDGRT